MNGSNGRPSSLYEQTLECARHEIDEASAEIAQMRDRLMGLEARMEAAKAVYEAVAARLNIEDEINEAPPEEVEKQIPEPSTPPLSQEEISRLLHAQKSAQTPNREAPTAPQAPPPQPNPVAQEPIGLPSSESDLIRQHLQARSGAGTVPQAPATQPQAPAPAAQEPAGLPSSESDLIRQHLQAQSGAESASPKASVAEPKPSTPAPAGGLNEEDRMLIEEHLRRRIESESHNT